MPNLRGVTAGAAIVGVGYATWLLSDWGGTPVIRIVDDAGLIFFAAFAAACAAITSFRARGKARAGWASLAVGAAGWAAGEAAWCYYDLVLGEQPFPSWADAGYALFLAGAALCLWLLLSAHPLGIQLRIVLDGIIVGAAIFCAVWAMLLAPAYTTAQSAWMSADVLALSYPLVDIGLVTMATLLLSRATAAQRPMLVALTVGLMLMTLSDTALAYLTSVSGYDEHHAIAIGWAWGFLCLGVAALVAPSTAFEPNRGAAPTVSRAAVWLPYVPVVVSAAICTPVLIVGLGPVFIAAAVTVFAVMVRQFLVLADNGRLLGKVADQALRDPLTGLANRAMFQERLSYAMRLHQRHSMAVGVLVMDLDRFKTVNEDYGHPTGDAVLIRVAERLASTVRSSDTVARFGGDEFAVLLEGDADTARALARRVMRAFERPFHIAGEDLVVRPSVGLAVAPAGDSDITADELLGQADIAMNTAKRAVSHQLVVFEPHLDADGKVTGQHRDPAGFNGELDVQGSERLLDELRYAIEHFELSVVYQPKFDLRTYEVCGLEALVRWPHPRRGLLTPNQFLPLVRQHGLMRSVTSLVLERALDDAAQWYRKGLGVPVAVNVFAPSISDPELPGQIVDALDRRNLPTGALTVEITEDLLLDNLGKTRMVFNKLRDKGIRVAIDDFGSGYSALWYLREFPVDEVKLDREFIAPILTHPASAAIVRAVVDLAHALGVTPVAEGVENAETANQLLEYGCEVAQGFLYSPPLPAPAIEKLLESHKRALGGDYESAGTNRSDIELLRYPCSADRVATSADARR